MIKNERQYKITRSNAGEVRVAISELESAPLSEELDPGMRVLRLEALSGTLGDLESELAAYDPLHDATPIEGIG